MPSLPYDDCVFINCPFTDDYQALFRALVFAVADCGFIPRCSLERSDSAETRIDKLIRIIGDCRYGVHDISATDLDPTNHLPRFNMPLELGLFLGARRFGSNKQKRKGALILDVERYRYQKYCSDIAGQDPRAHSGEPRQAVRCVRNWLRGERPGVLLPSGKRMFERYERFQGDLPVVSESLMLEPDDLQFNDLTSVVEEWLRINSW